MAKFDEHNPRGRGTGRHSVSPLRDPRGHGTGRHSASPLTDGTSTGSSMKKKHLLAGLGWNTLGQFLVVGISLGLTPFLLHRLSATGYGIFVLVSSIKGLISNLDGGLGSHRISLLSGLRRPGGRSSNDQSSHYHYQLGNTHRRGRVCCSDTFCASSRRNICAWTRFLPAIRKRLSNSSGI